MWILHTNTPKSRKEANHWDSCEIDAQYLADEQGMNVQDQWWWYFQDKKTANMFAKILKTANTGNGMKLYMKPVIQIPYGWQ